MLELNFNESVFGEIREVSSKDIAIIGISARLPMADNIEQFWDNLINGRDCVGSLSHNRKRDIEDYIKFSTGSGGQIEYADGGYLKDIDKFDNEFFKITNKEANLMDPNQRMFLECAWKAIEDSGYGGKKLVGSRTGVYVGFTPRGEYRKFITEVEPESLTVAETGNLSSIVASRIAYILDFRGPSMIVNTECSSSLVAVHLACKGLRNGECDMAIAGGIRISFSPVVTDQKLGIESAGGKVCSFDDDSDGTVFGEGSVAVILKQLDKAVRDRDNIYAVIKGSAVNQDGASVGITAPNMLAQEDVIINAWKDAGIDPETITYIEAHGTGTKLGDPIEINGINRAFRRYTHKKQFCGIGSVKSNIAHLDNVAGLAGMVKAVMCLKNKKIPPTLHFKKPNRKISFEDSAVYVNNKLTEWETMQKPRRCGISSFGLSGTNCHVILEEAPEFSGVKSRHASGMNIFTVSASKKKICMDIAGAMRDFIAANRQTDFDDMCYTANTGRGHYNFRIAVIASDIDGLKASLDKICEYGLENIKDENIFWGEHHVVPNSKENPGPNEIYESYRKELSRNANLLIDRLNNPGTELKQEDMEEICRLYVQCADLEWENLYSNGAYSKVSLPSYPFERKRCWLETGGRTGKSKNVSVQAADISYDHPLLDRLAVESVTQDIYITHFNVDRHWVLSEHNIVGKYLVPGTAYLEMARECGSRYLKGKAVEFRNVAFLNSLVVEEGESKEIQTVITKNGDYLEFSVAGRQSDDESSGGKWIVYCEGKLYGINGEAGKTVDVKGIRSVCGEKVDISKGSEELNTSADFRFGPRWTSVMQSMYLGDEEVFAELKLPEEFGGDLNEYYLHPSLLDMAVNAITQNTGNGIYLPLSYDSFKVYAPTKDVLYSHVKRTKSAKNLETMSFDVRLFDGDENLMAEVNNLTVKRVHKEGSYSKNEEGIFYKIGYTEAESRIPVRYYVKESVLVFTGQNRFCGNIVTSLRNSGRKVIEVNIGDGYLKNKENRYTISNRQEDYIKLFEELKNRDIVQIVHLLTVGCGQEDVDGGNLEESQKIGVYSLYNIARAMIHNKITDKSDITVVSDKVNRVVEEQTSVNAWNAPLFGLGKVLGKEFSNIDCRVIDIDEFTGEDAIASEINSEPGVHYTAYRHGKRYVEILSEADIQSGRNFEDCIKEDGVYVITGGMGSLGVQMAKCLSEAKRVNIALIGRKELPPCDEWTEFLKYTGKKLSENIKTIQDVIDKGSSVSYYSADVSDAGKMSKIIKELRQKYGNISGIIHAAGTAGDGYIINKTPENFKEVLKPKVHGTFLLDRLTESDKPDFFVCFSSISSVYGYPGQSDYVAANSYMDSFSASRWLQGKKTLSINWAPWKETGMAYDYGLTDDGVFKMLHTDTAVNAFKKALTSDCQNIIIGKLNTEAVAAAATAGEIPFMLAKEIKARIDKRLLNNKGRQAVNDSVSIDIRGRADNNYSESERVLAGIWGNALGMDNMDIYANFMELGGDSILAVELLKKIEKVYPGIVGISDIFSYPSVIEMAKFIDGKTSPGKEKRSRTELNENHFSDIVGILERLETGTISVDEADDILTQI